MPTTGPASTRRSAGHAKRATETTMSLLEDDRPDCIVLDCDQLARHAYRTQIGNVDGVDAVVPLCSTHYQKIEQAHQNNV